MTWALCLNCGRVKFGASCPCDACGVGSTGRVELDIAFSDWHLPVPTLEALGRVIGSIHQASHDERLCFLAFLYYVQLQHPRFIGLRLDKKTRSRCEEILALAAPPRIRIDLAETSL